MFTRGYTSPFSVRLVAVVYRLSAIVLPTTLHPTWLQQATHPRAHHVPAESVPAHPTSPGHDDVAVHLGGKAEISVRLSAGMKGKCTKKLGKPLRFCPWIYEISGVLSYFPFIQFWDCRILNHQKDMVTWNITLAGGFIWKWKMCGRWFCLKICRKPGKHQNSTVDHEYMYTNDYN